LLHYADRGQLNEDHDRAGIDHIESVKLKEAIALSV